jgi:hypothetical protein
MAAGRLCGCYSALLLCTYFLGPLDQVLADASEPAIPCNQHRKGELFRVTLRYELCFDRSIVTGKLEIVSSISDSSSPVM